MPAEYVKVSNAHPKPNLRAVYNEPVPAEDPADTYLVNSQGEAERAPADLDTKHIVRHGSYFLYLGIAIGVLAVIAIIQMV
ncbi:MAG: hypothetical protein ACU0GG_04400 [Paracoccaceae bacterium]